MKNWLWLSTVLFCAAAIAQTPHKSTKDDQRGTVNLITPAKVKQATSLVKEGITVSLEHPLLMDPAPDNGNPLMHTMMNTGENPVIGVYAMDSYSIAYHGYAHTHMDALGHAFQGGKMYNG